MKKRPMKRVDKTLEKRINAFWNKLYNPVTMWIDDARSRKPKSDRTIL